MSHDVCMYRRTYVSITFRNVRDFTLEFREGHTLTLQASQQSDRGALEDITSISEVLVSIMCGLSAVKWLAESQKE